MHCNRIKDSSWKWSLQFFIFWYFYLKNKNFHVNLPNGNVIIILQINLTSLISTKFVNTFSVFTFDHYNFISSSIKFHSLLWWYLLHQQYKGLRVFSFREHFCYCYHCMLNKYNILTYAFIQKKITGNENNC